MTDGWISVEQIAKYLGVSEDTVYRWIKEKGHRAKIPLDSYLMAVG